jgi:hypothetical protein
MESMEGTREMMLTILNVFALFVATFAVLIFAVLFIFFMFMVYACVYLGWKEMKTLSIPQLWNRINK